MSEFNTDLQRTLHHHDAVRGEVAQDIRTLPALLLARSRGAMSDIALADAEGAHSYETLLLRAVGIAAALRARGASYNDCIGLFVDSSADLSLALWGVLFSGAAYLPLATDYPQDRLSYMVKDARVRLVVTNHRSAPKLDGLLLPGIDVLNIDELTPASVNEIDTVLSELQEQDGEDLAYVIYTSGTTGRPKGVAISQQAIVRQMQWVASEGYLKPGDRILQKTPVSFDAAQWELLGMCCGAQVVMGAPGIYRDPEGLIRQIQAFNISTLQGVPTLLQALSELPAFAACRSLTHVFSGGEGLSRKLARNMLQIHPQASLVNLYGPTECTINASHHVIRSDSFADEWEIAPIGRPVAGLGFHVLDPDLAPVAPGTAGELFISGAQLANGYLFRPEQSEEKFPLIGLPGQSAPQRFYRTGDLVRQDSDGVLHFVGRVDNQVKFRGYRIELDEIRLAIENHDWVKSAAVFIAENERTGQAQLIGAVELNPNEARLMDQGAAESHHQTKSTRVQIRAQLSGRGFRDEASLHGKPTWALAGRQPSAAQRERAFARKTYRFFHGGAVSAQEIRAWLALQPVAQASRSLAQLDEQGLGETLRELGQFTSEQRLLPKFAYASPGALYATQVYLELHGIAGLPAGHYYYHPVQHSLTLLAEVAPAAQPRARLHFVGKVPAIREVYKNNILEVLEMEAGHILGLLDHVLPERGLALGQGLHQPEVLGLLDCPDEHAYLGSFELVPLADRIDGLEVDVYVQAQQGRVGDLADGQYLYEAGQLRRISDFLIEQRHVIAINQQVYQRASGGVSFVSRSAETWRQYIDLGRSLQRLQMNRVGLGTMSSGYSSKSGNDLATALRLNDIVADAGLPSGPSYFCLFGKISPAQAAHEGMDEDAVHMRGPAELIRADLFTSLPDYMVPGRIAIVNKMPHSASGKVDVAALKRSEAFQLKEQERPSVAPRNATEAAVAQIWRDILALEELSVEDDFFELGGNSIQAVAIAHALNRRFGTQLPIQVIFTRPTVAALSAAVSGGAQDGGKRAILLAGQGASDADRQVFCWPGLGGYPMNLRRLGEAVAGKGRFYGMQAQGINAGEQAFASIEALASADVQLIRSLQARGPYALWGYSFGARVAYEVAYQLEQAGEAVSELVLLAPGSPRLPYEEPLSREEGELFANPAFLTILLSVFAHDIDPQLSAACLAQVRDRAGFLAFVTARFPALEASLVEAIVDVVRVSYSPDYQIDLRAKPLACPVRVWRARGDGPSFVEAGSAAGLDIRLQDLAVGHYAVLQQDGVAALLAADLH